MKFPLIISILVIFLIGIYLLYPGKTQKAEAELAMIFWEEEPTNFAILQGNTISAIASPFNPEPKVGRTIRVVITGYSSTEDQTDSDPFITAAGTLVKDGIIATNLLPFGARIKIPELYGDKVFVVEDRMSWGKGNYQIDIWFPTRELALEFGVRKAEALILSD